MCRKCDDDLGQSTGGTTRASSSGGASLASSPQITPIHRLRAEFFDWVLTLSAEAWPDLAGTAPPCRNGRSLDSIHVDSGCARFTRPSWFAEADVNDELYVFQPADGT